MRDLMSDDINQRLIASKHGRRDKGQARILHTSERERSRHDQQVVLRPQVRTANGFGCGDESFRVAEFLGCFINDVLLGPDVGSWTNLLRVQVADSNCQEIRWDWHLLLEPRDSRVVALANGRH